MSEEKTQTFVDELPKEITEQFTSEEAAIQKIYSEVAEKLKGAPAEKETKSGYIFISGLEISKMEKGLVAHAAGGNRAATVTAVTEALFNDPITRAIVLDALSDLASKINMNSLAMILSVSEAMMDQYIMEYNVAGTDRDTCDCEGCQRRRADATKNTNIN